MKHLQGIEGSVLLLVDVQDNHFPHCVRKDETLTQMRKTLEAAATLGVNSLVTEHYPKAFGRTVAPLSELLGNTPVLPKISFSCLGDDAVRSHIESLGAKNLVLIGTETHICVCQTALSALELGLRATVVADAVTGRNQSDHDLALDRMRSHGVDVLTFEMLVYEWMRKAGTPAFKKILPLVKD